MTKIKIEIKSFWGKVLFTSETRDNIKEALQDAVLRGAVLQGAVLQDADLRGADLQGADLRDAVLQDADLRDAVLRGAVLRGAVLRGADLQGADLQDAVLQGADLRGVAFDKLPQDFINQCSRDILFIFQCLKSELPAFKDKLIAGEIDGSQYTGDCACLVGTLAKTKGEDVDKICSSIPFYQKGTQNMGETWFLNIRKGDTPENNEFSKHVLNLIEMAINSK